MPGTAPLAVAFCSNQRCRLVKYQVVDRCGYCDVFSDSASGPPVALDTADFVSFMGRYQPTGPGYSLVVPRRHVVDLHDLRDDELAPTLRAVRLVASAVQRAFSVSGTTVMQNNGSPGQRVMHLHFHVIPRWAGDGYPSSTDVEIGVEELERQAALLRAELADCP